MKNKKESEELQAIMTLKRQIRLLSEDLQIDRVLPNVHLTFQDDESFCGFDIRPDNFQNEKTLDFVKVFLTERCHFRAQ